mgnify:CR=1 FL=1
MNSDSKYYKAFIDTLFMFLSIIFAVGFVLGLIFGLIWLFVSGHVFLGSCLVGLIIFLAMYSIILVEYHED